jgi:hypothetical protein
VSRTHHSSCNLLESDHTEPIYNLVMAQPSSRWCLCVLFHLPGPGDSQLPEPRESKAYRCSIYQSRIISLTWKPPC